MTTDLMMRVNVRRNNENIKSAAENGALIIEVPYTWYVVFRTRVPSLERGYVLCFVIVYSAPRFD